MATVLLSMVITNTPKKLNTAAIRIAGRGPIARVETQVAMALGASVQPFTRMTPKVSSTVISNAGFCSICPKNHESEMFLASFP